MNKDTIKGIGLTSLVLMIFSSIYGFSNSLNAYFQMGYASIIWYVIAALLFFVPSSIMFAEYGATFKAARGGIFSWLRGSIGEKPAFIGSFIWLAAWVVWLVSSTQFFLVSVSTMISGTDETQSWHLFGLGANETLGILEIIFLFAVTLIASRGIDKIAKIASICGIFTLGISVLFILISLLVWVLNHGTLAEAVTPTAMVKSPNPQFLSPIAVVSFIVYALFAYGGMETMAGVIDAVHKPERTFPRAIILATIIMTVLYILTIFLCGVTANWHQLLGKSNVNLANVEYVLINNMGYVMGTKLGVSHSTALTIGRLFAQFTALTDVFGGLGAAFVMTYSPIKSFIEGCDPRLLPKRLTKLNNVNMPAFAMWMQAILVSVIILFISFGGDNAAKFYTVLTDMMNVSSSAPYLFLIGAFPFFKQKQGLDRPFVFYKNMKVTWVVSIIVWLVVAIGIIFTCVEPILEHDYSTAFWTAFGPVFFGLLAWSFYTFAEKRVLIKNGQTEI
ncbi:glutamate/gamma-aminobutyrate family transporter YjeM [Lactobacillus sp. Marseille-P7033]|nr:glutamate/gamma-aminobutyrate family transporter YjeM [Lactobacillus sp. Marseille-P7033]